MIGKRRSESGETKAIGGGGLFIFDFAGRGWPQGGGGQHNTPIFIIFFFRGIM